jgi:hypothetical protein
MTQEYPLTVLTSSKLSLPRFVTVIAARPATLSFGLYSSFYFANALGSSDPPRSLSEILWGNSLDLNRVYQDVNIADKKTIATSVNGFLPEKILSWKAGLRVTIRIKTIYQMIV